MNLADKIEGLAKDCPNTPEGAINFAAEVIGHLPAILKALRAQEPPADVAGLVTTLRASIWNNLGHDQKLGRALSKFGMVRFNTLVDELIATTITAQAAENARLRAALEKIESHTSIHSSYEARFVNQIARAALEGSVDRG